MNISNEKKIVIEKKNNLVRRVVEGLAVGIGIAIGLQAPSILVKLFLLL